MPNDGKVFIMHNRVRFVLVLSVDGRTISVSTAVSTTRKRYDHVHWDDPERWLEFLRFPLDYAEMG